MEKARRRSSRGRRSSISVVPAMAVTGEKPTSPTVVDVPLSQSILGDTNSEKIMELRARKETSRKYIEKLENEIASYHAYMARIEAQGNVQVKPEVSRSSITKALQKMELTPALRPRYRLNGILQMFTNKINQSDKKQEVGANKEKVAELEKKRQKQRHYNEQVVQLLQRDATNHQQIKAKARRVREAETARLRILANEKLRLEQLREARNRITPGMHYHIQSVQNCL